MNSIHRIAYTPGEPAGIGPDLAIIHAQRAHQYEFISIADPSLLAQRAQQLGLACHIKAFEFKQSPCTSRAGELLVLPTQLIEKVVTGKPSQTNAPYVIHCLDKAIEVCLTQQCQALVTGPIQKSIINDSGIAFTGHTEYLAQQTGAAKVVMMLATEGLRVALATTHIPLKAVSEAITPKLLTQVLSVLHHELQVKFGLPSPKILVCGLNPHSGEAGHLGREEIDTITPTLEKLRQQGLNCRGPLPADTLFTPKYLEEADVVLAMYHDQGLPVLKYKGFGRAANITLGLPIVRTSVDHGTALGLAGTGNIDSGSLSSAIESAITMADTLIKGTDHGFTEKKQP